MTRTFVGPLLGATRTRALAAVAALTTALGLGCDPMPFPGPVRIMQLGDSITQGDANHLSYRYRLWQRLVDSGLEFDLVGSERANHKGTPFFPPYKGRNFDQDHEGHWGFRTDELLAGLNGGWLNGYVPDIALVHVGSNDMFQNQDIPGTVNEIRQVLNRIRARNPSVRILLARPIPTTFSAESDFLIAQLSQQIDGIAASMTTLQSPVSVVDQRSGFNAATDTYDRTHPNEVGEQKMAGRWFTAIMNAVGATAVSNVRVVAPDGRTLQTLPQNGSTVISRSALPNFTLNFDANGRELCVEIGTGTAQPDLFLNFGCGQMGAITFTPSTPTEVYRYRVTPRGNNGLRGPSRSARVQLVP